MGGFRVCQRVARRPAATTVRSRPLRVVENASFRNGYSYYSCSYRYAGIIDRDNRTALVPFQFLHTAIAAAAAAAARYVVIAVLSVGRRACSERSVSARWRVYAERNSKQQAAAAGAAHDKNAGTKLVPK